ncbi:hypothetical protein SDC9_211359 [bioreactor metagenome]|uniref:Uncharacterized protein n=1 Tax=bioreactor metagenome TaxID=1076179 RepID=A0A645JIT6_9ZZZZ
MHDEELAARRVGHHAARHRQHAARVLERVGKAVLAELARDRVARSAHAGAGRVAALDHEAGNHAVEDQPVVKALLDQVHEVGDRIGRDFGEQLGLNHIAVVHFDGHNGVHAGILLVYDGFSFLTTVYL